MMPQSHRGTFDVAMMVENIHHFANTINHDDVVLDNILYIVHLMHFDCGFTTQACCWNLVIGMSHEFTDKTSLDDVFMVYTTQLACKSKFLERVKSPPLKSAPTD